MTRAIIFTKNQQNVIVQGGARVITVKDAALWSSLLGQARTASDTAVGAAAAALAAAGVDSYDDTTDGLAGTSLGETFWVDLGNGTGQVYRHDAGPVATVLQKFIIDPTLDGASSIIGIDGADNIQDAIIVAADTAALIASTKALTAGSTVRTADGFVYQVASSGASDHHLTTGSGAKLYVIPQGPSARQWGILPDTGVDLANRLIMAQASYPDLQLEEGVYLTSKGVRQVLNSSFMRGSGIGKTILRAIDPLSDGNFDGTVGSEALVWAEAAEGAPLFGLKCEDMTLDCAGLMTGLPSGDVRLKGHHYRRVHNFEVNRVEVLDCGSYAFWANDKPIEDGGTITGCIGVYNDCVAKDAQIFFETTGRCFITYNRPRAEQTRDTWDWSVLETFHFYGGDGLITVNDAYAKVDSSTIIGPLLTQNNVVWNGGYFEQLNDGTTVINMGTPTGNYDGWAFNDVTMIGAGAIGAISFGGASGADNKMVINGGKYIANEGAGPTFTAIDDGWGSVDMFGVDCMSTTSDAAVPRAVIVSGTFKSFNVIGGNQAVFGPSADASPVNAPTAKFTSVTMHPSSSVTETIRQSKRGSAAFANGGGFAQINLAIPINVANKAKLVVTGAVEASATDATGAGEGVAITWNNPSANIINILAPSAAVGRTFNYLIVEYE